MGTESFRVGLEVGSCGSACSVVSLVSSFVLASCDAEMYPDELRKREQEIFVALSQEKRRQTSCQNMDREVLPGESTVTEDLACEDLIASLDKAGRA